MEGEAPFAPWFAGWRRPWHFAGAEETATRLERAGFVEVRTWLERREVRPPEPRGYLESICLGAHLQRVPAELRGPFVEGVRTRLGDPVRIDYVRLNLSARRPA